MRNYRNAFVFALVGNLALLAIVGGLWWRGKQHREAEAAMQPPSTESAQSPPNGSESAAMASHEAALVPVQLSPDSHRIVRPISDVELRRLALILFVEPDS